MTSEQILRRVEIAAVAFTHQLDRGILSPREYRSAMTELNEWARQKFLEEAAFAGRSGS